MLIAVFVLSSVTCGLGQDLEVEREWRARQQKIQTLRCEIAVKKTVLAEALDALDGSGKYPPNDTELAMSYRLLLKGDGKFYTSREGKEFDLSSGRIIERVYQNGWLDGRRRTFFAAVVTKEDSFPSGMIRGKSSDWDNYHILPMLLSAIPFNPHFSPATEEPYELYDLRPVIEGVRCVRYGPVSQTEKPMYLFDVAPEKGMAIARITKTWMGTELWHANISLEEVQDIGWLPKAFEVNQYYGKQLAESFTADVVSIEVNSTIDDAEFFVDFPVGTLVSEKLGDKSRVYVRKENGQERIVTRQERMNGFDYQRYLVTESGEAVPVKRSSTRYALWLFLACSVFGVSYFYFRSCRNVETS